MTGYSIACDGISKQFDGVPVLTGIRANFQAGAVTVLAGENGAGKSTLFKIIAGQLPPDGGELRLFGDLVTHFSPRHAQRLGVSIIPQELQPVKDLTVYENLLLGSEIVGPFGFLNRGRMMEAANQLITEFGADLDPRSSMRRLNVASTQLVEIIKAISRQAKIVLMDEPTSSLSEHEIQRLFRAIQFLKKRGVTILYTTHKMEEIAAIADDVAVLRDGVLIRHCPVVETDQHRIITDMVGREVEDLFPHRDWSPRAEAPILEVKDFQVHGYRARHNFRVHRGEIVGLAGLIGAGRSEMLEAISGTRRSTGQLKIEGRSIPLRKPMAAIRAGIATVPEERKSAGLVLSMSVLDNLTLPRVGAYSERVTGFLYDRERKQQALSLLQTMRVRYSRLGQPISHLSGGNQQKIVLARWLMSHRPKLLILDEPTRGIDVGAKAELYKLIVELADQGAGILLASSDMNELLNLSHRVLVFRQGEIVGELDREELEQEAILRLAMGVSVN
jgi:ribose transport system ATP-binding protein